MGGTIIVLKNVLKIWPELIKYPNDNAVEKFYRLGFELFLKVAICIEISKILGITNK